MNVPVPKHSGCLDWTFDYQAFCVPHGMIYGVALVHWKQRQGRPLRELLHSGFEVRFDCFGSALDLLASQVGSPPEELHQSRLTDCNSSTFHSVRARDRL